MSIPSERMAELNIVLPDVARPVGSYLPARRVGDLVFVSGQLPLNGEKLVTGLVGGPVSLESAARAARTACANALAAAAQVAGGVDAIKGIVRVAVFVASADGFTEQAAVANGASDLLTEVFGDAGRHVRSAVGVALLPKNACVEVELIAQL
ncbi:Enamine deaminase RidA, house cleaning of reactive enamine intermediates, YjgF/YER057c/UK114 family [Propionibacterium cyclohexanicum]|uniref:Enamine deaminase RidA, house cleaning of reactive enamine intermediates, YjgF/YER057c/UK114 family n=1 Tax=Propionibacterium cyclohexanicum TaxID=64702 RepID=A0A1H9TE40_9ACTN|nr:RidA family protein [Propionibacterium cyclohexanicum]SER94873.1 Enamine deaminase RidA, house cleaning of reactive enamine intermediates, YjgF/YER057c/UK114 family [Propionibacterium cyclohexanicum]